MRKYLLYFISTILVVLFLYIVIKLITLGPVLDAAREKIKSYNSQNLKLSYGNISYVDAGNKNSDKVILSLHGLYGGYDQGYDNISSVSKEYRILAPSRFGYLGSDVKGNGTPKEQSDALIEFLDKLGIEKVYLLGASAGGTPAIKMALEYPNRVEGLILLVSAAPLAKPTSQAPGMMGPPSFFNNDSVMWIISPLFESILGMDNSTIYSMLPLEERKKGVEIDSNITNPDMIINYESYDIESLKMPVLIIHAKDDKTAPFEKTESSMFRYPNLKTKIFEKGGHLLKNNGDEVKNAILEFVKQ